MSHTSLPYFVVMALVAGGAISWLVLMKHFLVMRAELRRAREAGEVPDLPIGTRGLPTAIFLSDVLPAVADSRRKLLRAVASFLGFCLAAAAVIALFGPRH